MGSRLQSLLYDSLDARSLDPGGSVPVRMLVTLGWRTRLRADVVRDLYSSRLPAPESTDSNRSLPGMKRTILPYIAN
jgi:hypothetical protein